jgi:hypothetical protein
VLGSEDDATDGAVQEPVLPANPRHDAKSVETALRWAMGLITMMPLDVHACTGVLRCEPHSHASQSAWNADAWRLPLNSVLR